MALSDARAQARVLASAFGFRSEKLLTDVDEPSDYTTIGSNSAFLCDGAPLPAMPTAPNQITPDGPPALFVQQSTRVGAFSMQPSAYARSRIAVQAQKVQSGVGVPPLNSLQAPIHVHIQDEGMEISATGRAALFPAWDKVLFEISMTRSSNTSFGYTGLYAAPLIVQKLIDAGEPETGIATMTFPHDMVAIGLLVQRKNRSELEALSSKIQSVIASDGRYPQAILHLHVFVPNCETYRDATLRAAARDAVANSSALAKQLGRRLIAPIAITADPVKYNLVCGSVPASPQYALSTIPPDTATYGDLLGHSANVIARVRVTYAVR